MSRAAHLFICLLLTAPACDRKVEEPPAPASAATAPTPPILSAAMVEQMLAQLVLDHPQVAPFLHTEIPANLPLRVAPSPDLAQGAASLRVAGQAARVVTVSEARVVFKGRERLGPVRERIRFEIPAEGVVGHVDLELTDNVWHAIDGSVAER